MSLRGGSTAGRTGRARSALAAVLVMAVLAGAACGGDDDDAEPSGDGEGTEQISAGPPLTAEELKAKANELCLAYRARTEDLALAAARKEGSGLQPTVRETREYVSKTLPEFLRLLEEMKELTPPADVAQTYADLIDVGERGAETAAEIKEDNERLLSREYGDSFLAFNRGANYLGFEQCVAE